MEGNLLRFNKTQKYLFWDKETEDLRLNGNRPWQLSYILATQNEILEEHDKFLWWDDLQMSSGAAAITRFNHEDYKRKSQDPLGIIEEFDSYLYDPDIINVGANLWGFDIFVHNTTRQLLGKKTDYSYVKNLLCIQSIEKAKHLGIKQISQNPMERTALMLSLTNYRKKGLKTNVKHLCSEYGVDYDPFMAHDGLVDCGYTRSIFNKQIWSIDI